MSDITLSSAVRKNLLSLQNTAMWMGKTQERLSTGKKVNSALDNPTNFFTAASLNSRSNDLGRLLDSVGNAIQTLEAADNGIKAVTRLVESAQATARQALQGAKGAIIPSSSDGVDIEAKIAGLATNPANLTGTFTVQTGTGAGETLGTLTTITTDGKSLEEIRAEIDAVTDLTATVEEDPGTGTFRIKVVSAGDEFTIADTEGAASATLGLAQASSSADLDGAYHDMNIAGNTSNDIPSLTTAGTMTFNVDGTETVVTIDGTESFDKLVEKISAVEGLTATAIESTTTPGQFKLKVEASTNVSKFSIADTTGTTAADLGIDGDNDVEASLTTPSETRKNYEKEFNALLKQIDDLSQDSSFNGNNLLERSSLKVIFNEDGTSAIEIKGVDISASGLKISPITDGDFQFNNHIETTLDSLDTAMKSLRDTASTFGSNLSVVQTRQDFTKNMMNTLETGAANLTLADINEEGANMLALQTRQQLSTTALSMASQADQSVLSLF